MFFEISFGSTNEALMVQTNVHDYRQTNQLDYVSFQAHLTHFVVIFLRNMFYGFRDL